MWDANLNSVVHPRDQGWAASIRLILFKIMAVKQFYFIVKSEKYMILFVYPIFSLHKTQFALVWTIHEIPDGASISNKSDAAGKPQITLGARVWIMTGTIATLGSRSLHSSIYREHWLPSTFYLISNSNWYENQQQQAAATSATALFSLKNVLFTLYLRIYLL